MAQSLDLTGEEMVLVHLLDAPKGSEWERHPSAAQQGISGGTGMERSYVSVVLKKAQSNGSVARSLDRVSGSKRKVAVFCLTPAGFERALSVKQRLMGSMVRIKSDGKVREIEMREALKLFSGETVASLAAKVQKGVPEADAGKPILEEIAAARKFLDGDRQADCAALMRSKAQRWIRAGFHDEFLALSASVTKARIPVEDAAALLLAEADIHETRGDWERARMCLALIECELPRVRGEAMFRLGVIAYRQNALEEAEKLYARADALVEGGDPLKGRIFNAVGIIEWSRENAAEASRKYAEAERIALEFGDAEGLMRVRANLGILAMDAGELAKAIDYYAKAITAAEAMDDVRAVCSLYSNVGDVYAQKGDKNEARRFYERSMTLAERLSFRWQIAELHRSLAGVTDGEEREKHLRSALEIFQELGSESDAYKVREMMGEG
ncbi:MAG: tetratricopeptide repeat protein [Euryarchaeota archaeon]|nr:tetratricopeptide repeat protein [Euryarchaeota archaeon]